MGQHRSRWRASGNAPLNGARLALEPVRDEDLVLLPGAGREDVGALDSLVKVAKNVVDDDDSLGGVGRASHVCGELDVVSRSTRVDKGVTVAIQVLRPSTSSYEPLALYPLDTTGGMLQQASLWPWDAGIVDMVAIGGVAGLAKQSFLERRAELMVCKWEEGRSWQMLGRRPGRA